MPGSWRPPELAGSVSLSQGVGFQLRACFVVKQVRIHKTVSWRDWVPSGAGHEIAGHEALSHGRASQTTRGGILLGLPRLIWTPRIKGQTCLPMSFRADPVWSELVRSVDALVRTQTVVHSCDVASPSCTLVEWPRLVEWAVSTRGVYSTSSHVRVDFVQPKAAAP